MELEFIVEEPPPVGLILADGEMKCRGAEIVIELHAAPLAIANDGHVVLRAGDDLLAGERDVVLRLRRTQPVNCGNRRQLLPDLLAGDLDGLLA